MNCDLSLRRSVEMLLRFGICVGVYMHPVCIHVHYLKLDGVDEASLHGDLAGFTSLPHLPSSLTPAESPRSILARMRRDRSQWP